MGRHSFFSGSSIVTSILFCSVACTAFAQDKALPFPGFPNLETKSTGEWWTIKERLQKRQANNKNSNKRADPRKKPTDLVVPRDEVVAFAVYTHDRGVLKLTAQLYPLKPDETREVRLEFEQDGEWKEVAKQDAIELGWSAHFRLDDWDNTKDVRYRVRHGERAEFTGRIRRDPIEKDVIVVGNMSCNSSRTPGPRPKIVENLKQQDPDLLFFAGDQSYHHTEHTYGWIEVGVQFRDILRDRPVVTIPDDHDVGQANIWGENGKKATNTAGPSGGFFFPAKYVNICLLYTSPSPRDATLSRMPSSA